MPSIAVGTCGYSYRDWVGPLYPPGTRSGEMLGIYARRFGVVEIDSTYYRVPAASTFDSMARRTPAGFRFTAKLPSSGTHLPDLGSHRVHDDVLRFCRNIAPLVQAGKFACALAQFPNSFRPNDASRSYLAALREAFGDVALVAEFRHRDWQTNATIELLRELRVGLVNVDQPHFKTLMRESGDVTSDIAYVRFHGRNVTNWWRGTNETRYDYLYTPEELVPWVERIIDISANPDVREVFAFFNNHRRGQAVQNAEMLSALLGARLPNDVTVVAAPANDLAQAPELPFPDE